MRRCLCSQRRRGRWLRWSSRKFGIVGMMLPIARGPARSDIRDTKTRDLADERVCSDHPYKAAIGLERRVGGQKRQALFHRLGDEQAIEWIAVDPRQ